MTLWIDGDSCPRTALRISLKKQGYRGMSVCVVADRALPGVNGTGAEMKVLTHGAGEVDSFIETKSVSGDLVLTRDYALGIRLLEKDVTVINDRGHVWTFSELRGRAEDASIQRAMREGGYRRIREQTYSREDAEAFANSLNSLLSRKTQNH